jgi:phage terminase large subunit-like protein
VRRLTSSRALVSRHAAAKRFSRIELEGREFPDYPGMAIWYAQEVMKGVVPACKYEKQACERFLKMLEEAKKSSCPYEWSPVAVCDTSAFIEALPHVKGFDGPIVLQPVQCWWLAGIFGFRDRNSGHRWVREASLWIPRKNGKTLISVGIALFCANCEGEIGAEVTISAGSEGQANIPYGAMREMFAREPQLRDWFEIHDTRDFTEFRATGAKVTIATARAKNLDGYNPHMILAEELHAQSQDVIGVLRTAQGARSNPLNLSISTSGRDTGSAAYSDWLHSIAVLDGRVASPRLFTVIYAANKEDEDRRFDDKILEKVNPLWGVSLNPVSIDTEKIEARKNESKLQEFKRTRLNIWSRAAGNLISVDDWDACADPSLTLDAFKGYPVYVGLDLAARLDLNAAAFVTQVGETVYATSKYWLGRHSPRMRDDKFADAFYEWSEKGFLTLTDAFGGQYVDFRTILHDVLKEVQGHNVIGFAVDDQQANMMAAEIEEAGYQVYIFRKNARQMTPSTEDIIGRTTNPELLQHDDNPITAWCAGNVVGYWDQNANVLPKKETPSSKANIDGIDALIQANSLRMAYTSGSLNKDGKAPVINPYLSRGLAGYDKVA